MEELSNFISTVGFPIVVAIAMFYQNNIMSSTYQKSMEKLELKLDHNTQVLTRLLDKMGKDELLKEKSDDKDD